MTDQDKIIQNVLQYVNLNDEEKAYFLSLLKIRRYKKKQFILQNYDHCRYDFFIIEGLAKEYFTDINGKDFIIRFVKENEWTADYDSFLSGSESVLSIEVLEDVTAYTISYPDVQLLIKTYPIFEKCYRVYFQKAYTALQTRLVNSHTKTAEQRYKAFIEKEFNLSQRIPQHQIAAYLGVSAEFLSKIRKQIYSR